MGTGEAGSAKEGKDLKYRVAVDLDAQKELEDLPDEIVRRLHRSIDALADLPRPPGVKRLAGVNGYRIRKGDHRILFAVDDPKGVVTIFRVGHRKDVYRGIGD